MMCFIHKYVNHIDELNIHIRLSHQITIITRSERFMLIILLFLLSPPRNDMRPSVRMPLPQILG